MDVAAVMDEIATRLETITGWTVHPYPTARITAPAAIVDYPESITYDATMGRGSDSMQLPIVVAIGKGVDVSTRDRLAAYADGSGASSIKAVLESGTYTSCDYIVVTGVRFDVYAWNEVDYLVGIFDTEIVGSGS